MKVKNVKGTSERSCKCGSWLKHWENYTGQKAITCKAKGCYDFDIVGAHVIKCDSDDQKEYIVPFCQSHNKQEGCIELKEGTKLAPANKNDTCE